LIGVLIGRYPWMRIFETPIGIIAENRRAGSADGAIACPLVADTLDPAARRRILRDALSIAVATGVYGLTFGAISVAAGFSVWQTCALSLLMFSGASQYAFVALATSGATAALTATLLGVRNALYGLRLSELLPTAGYRRFFTAQLVIDESTAMALGREEEGPEASRLAFWSTGLAIYVLWNAATLIGAIAAGTLPDPKSYGLDAVAPAAFLALLAPRLRSRGPLALAILAAVVALIVTPFVPAGVAVLAAAAVAVGSLAFPSGAAATPPVAK
jgi:predicted branched-subunit amino acid permease